MLAKITIGAAAAFMLIALMLSLAGVDRLAFGFAIDCAGCDADASSRHRVQRSACTLRRVACAARHRQLQRRSSSVTISSDCQQRSSLTLTEAVLRTLCKLSLANRAI